jgi:MFS family permease
MLKGFKPLEAGLISSLVTFAFPATLFFPSISDTIGLRKPFVWVPALVLAVTAPLLGFASDPYVWLLAPIFGVCAYGLWSMIYLPQLNLLRLGLLEHP